jgi:hypothetical protein
MTGAIGSAKYSIGVFDGSGTHTEFVDIAWDNPYIGANSASISVTNDFSGTPSTDLDSASFIQSGSLPNAQKVAGLDVEAWLDTLLFPPYIIANAVSYNDTNAFYGISFQQPPQFQGDFPGPPDLKNQPRKLNVNANPADWRGQWKDDNIYVTIWDSGNGRMTVYVTDRTSNPLLEFSQDVVLGVFGWVAEHTLGAAIDSPLSGGSAAVSQVLRAATHEALKANSHAFKDVAEVFNRTAVNVAQKSGIKIGPARLRNATNAVATVIANARATILLVYGVSLTLYDVFSGNAKIGELISYQRTDSQGTILSSALLEFVPKLA